MKLPLVVLPAIMVLASCARARVELPTPAPSSSSTRERAAHPDWTDRLAEVGLMVPVEGVPPERVPDTFSARRGDRAHAAIDIMAPRGTRVISADSGTVRRISSNNLGGRTVYVVDIAKEYVHYYAHLDRYLPGLAEGQVVGPGDILGYVGATGNANPNEPHLHFQLMRYSRGARWWEGEPVNPHLLLRRTGRANGR